MSLFIYPEFDPELKGTTCDALGEVLEANYQTLDKIALSANITPFSAYGDNRPIPEDFDGDPNELAEVQGEWTEWFNPAEGLKTMQALAEHIKVNPETAGRLASPTEVVAELEELARVLNTAVEQGARFRLQMG